MFGIFCGAFLERGLQEVLSVNKATILQSQEEEIFPIIGRAFIPEKPGSRLVSLSKTATG
jgi:hypothetical protein